MRPNQQHLSLLMHMVLFMLTGLLLTACDDRPKIYTIGVVNTLSALESVVQGFKEGMSESGYIEGENVNYLYEGAIPDIDNLDPVAQRLTAANVDLILSVTTPATQAAQRATANTDIPVVFVPVTNPVDAGVVKSLKRPGGNITGVTFGIQEGRRLEWLLQVVPFIQHIYAPYNPDDRSAVLSLETVRATAEELGIEIVTRQVHTPDEVMAAIQSIPKNIDAIFFLPDSVVSARMPELVKAAIDLQLPSSGTNVESVKEGLLMSYGFEQRASGKQAARLATQILQGTSPADLPVETSEFSLIINLQTAEALGFEIPNEILLQADIIIR